MELTSGQNKALTAVNEAVANKQRLLLWWMGGVRSGKSYGTSLCFLEHQRNKNNAQYLILAYTQNQALKIFGKYFKEIGEALGFTVKVTSGSQPSIQVWPDGRPYKRGMDEGNVFIIKGADATGRDRNIQGLTCDGLLCDELPLLDRNTVHQAEARVSKPGGLRIYTSNKTHEYHWTVKYYVNRIKSGEIDGLVIDSPIQENQHIDSSYTKERCMEFRGNTLARFMNNEFTLEAPPIYDVKFDENTNTKGKLVISIYGHPNGYEVMFGRMTTKLYLESVWSLPTSTDIVEFIKEQIGKSKIHRIMLNKSQTILARWLRREQWPVTGYNGTGDSRVQEPLLKACSKGIVTMDPNSINLVEAVKTHHNPANYDFPCIVAMEALGYCVRSLLLSHAT